MYTWFSDLDNTLIYSHRTSFLTEKILVECLRGKEQSYMTQGTYEFMRDMNIRFIPVTTRSIEQYKRLFVFETKIKVKHALVCNGAILLENGNIDEEWVDETKVIAQEGICALADIQKELYEYDVNNVEGVMLYFKTDKPLEAADAIRSKYADKKVFIGFDKRKVYIIPSEINKGNAVRRYCNRFGITKSVSSGDSMFDIPMLDATNISVFPRTLLRQLNSEAKKYAIEDNQIISDDICEKLKIIIEENRL